jgi:large subunit ribosomal protein L10
MPLTRTQKETRVAEVTEQLKTATSVVFMAYDGLTVDESEELRDTLFTEKSSLRIIPKRLLRLALQLTGIDFDPVEIEGQIAKTHPTVRLVRGVLEGTLLSLEEVTSLAQLPSRQELLGQLVSVLVGPLRGLQTVLTGAQRDLVYALNAIVKEKQKV